MIRSLCGGTRGITPETVAISRAEWSPAPQWDRGRYRYHRRLPELGEFWPARDSVIPAFSGYQAMGYVLATVPSYEIEEFGKGQQGRYWIGTESWASRELGRSGERGNGVDPKFCSECGSRLAPGARFCSECGSRVFKSVDEAEAPGSAGPSDPDSGPAPVLQAPPREAELGAQGPAPAKNDGPGRASRLGYMLGRVVLWLTAIYFVLALLGIFLPATILRVLGAPVVFGLLVLAPIGLVASLIGLRDRDRGEAKLGIWMNGGVMVGVGVFLVVVQVVVMSVA